MIGGGATANLLISSIVNVVNGRLIQSLVSNCHPISNISFFLEACGESFAGHVLIEKEKGEKFDYFANKFHTVV